jgi:hypothetical protein
MTYGSKMGATGKREREREIYNIVDPCSFQFSTRTPDVLADGFVLFFGSF